MNRKEIHINCDVGESYGRYKLIEDDLLMPFIQACNIACGFHAGDPTIIKNTIKSALSHNVEIGAHPSYPDLVGFGRRNMALSKHEVFDIVLYQVSAIKSMTEALGGKLVHVKPHGALYNTAAKNKATAEGIAEAVATISKELILYTLPGSALAAAAVTVSLKVKREAFIDRRYMQDLSLSLRSHPKAVILDPQEAKEQADMIWHQRKVITLEGNSKPLEADTLCIHGDNPNALDILNMITKTK